MELLSRLDGARRAVGRLRGAMASEVHGLLFTRAGQIYLNPRVL
jgi:tRNA(His) 5'-end guanylyltransferase